MPSMAFSRWRKFFPQSLVVEWWLAGQVLKLDLDTTVGVQRERQEAPLALSRDRDHAPVRAASAKPQRQVFVVGHPFENAFGDRSLVGAAFGLQLLEDRLLRPFAAR
jgi:hypothetical protein